ncbi:MAG: invasion associated locus B family protein [Reyranella sp.]|nr:invasion associated locus B family protein [Reyranella sp.]
MTSVNLGFCTLRNGTMRRAIAFVAAVAAMSAYSPPTPAAAQAAAQDNPPPPAWRVDCSGDGKTLECRAIQQLVAQENKQIFIQLAARLGPDKAPVLGLQLPLGINLAEPIQLKVDAGKEERYQVQTCTNAGCLLSLPLKDPLLASMRTGTVLKVTVFDGNKRAITIDIPLLGFGLAFDKATKP